MSKYKPGDKFILEITEIDQEAFLRGYPYPTYLVKGMDGAFSENVLDKLDRVEPQMVRTNADNIRNMSIEDLAAVVMCPYTGEGVHKEALCEKMRLLTAPDDKICIECCKTWLQKEVSSGKA